MWSGAAAASEGASSDSPLSVAALALDEASEPSPSAAEPPPAVFDQGEDDDFAEHGAMGPPQPPIDGLSATVPALSFRQPFASLMLYNVKSLEARQKPILRSMMGTLALHVSHKEEPYGSPLTSAAVALLRRRYNDDAIANLFSLPQTMAQGHGCIVGLVDVECTWHADLFNEIEQAQLAEQAAFPVQGLWLTQLRNPRWLKCAPPPDARRPPRRPLSPRVAPPAAPPRATSPHAALRRARLRRYPVRTSGSNRLWHVQLPLDCLPDGTEVDGAGHLVSTNLRERPPLYKPGSAAPAGDGDDMGLGLLGGDFARTLHHGDGGGEWEKKKKKLQKALRDIEKLKAKRAEGRPLEKTQEDKIEREGELLDELRRMEEEGDGGDGGGGDAEGVLANGH